MLHIPNSIQKKYSDINLIQKFETYNSYTGIDKESQVPVLIYLYQTEGIFTRLEHIVRFYKDLKLFMSLKNHELTQILDFGEEDNQYYSVESWQTNQYLTSNQRLENIQKLITVIKKMCESLLVLHHLQIPHKNLTPNHFYLTPDTFFVQLKAYDLDYSSKIKTLIQSENIPYPLYFLAPEQTGFLSNKLDLRSNLFSLGIIFYEMITGKLPFKGSNVESQIYQLISQIPTPPSNHNYQVPEILDKIILKLLAKEPDERYQSLQGLLFDLNDLENNRNKDRLILGKHDLPVQLNFNPDLTARKEELSTLENFFNKLLDGKGSFILINGPAGVGKTKLSETFINTLIHQKNFKQISAFKCSISTANMPYLPFINLLKVFFDEYKELKVLEIIQNDYPFLMDFFPAYQKNKKKNHLIKQESVEELKMLVFTAILDILKYISSKKKFLILMEDIQWADQNSLELIQFLSKNIHELQMMFVLTSRDESKILYFENIPLIELNFLNQEETKNLIQKIFIKPIQLKEEFYKKIHSLSLGLPLYIAQIIKDLADNKILYHKENQFEINYKQFASFEFKDNNLKSRLSKLNQSEITILCIAAALGIEFDFFILNYFLEDSNNIHILKQLQIFPEEMDSSKLIIMLDKAKKEHIILEIPNTEGFFKFSHDEIMNRFYHFLDPIQKNLIHILIGQTFEKYFQHQINEYAYQIAYHYNQTDNIEKKLFYNHLAYKKALTHFSLTQSIFYLKKVVDYYLENQIINKNTVEFMTELCKIYLITGDFNEAIYLLNKSLDFSQENHWIEEIIHINSFLGNAYYFSNNISNAYPYYQKALEIADNNNLKLKIREPYFCLASYYFYKGDFKQTKENCDKTILYSSPNDLEKNLPVYALRALTYLCLGDLEKCLEDVHFAEDHLSIIKNPVIFAQVYHLLSFCYSYSLTNASKALDYSLKAYHYAEKSNYVIFQFFSILSQIKAYLALDMSKEAVAAAQLGRKILTPLKSILGSDQMNMFEAQALVYDYQFDASLELTTNSLKDKKNIIDNTALIDLMISQAIALYNKQELDACLEILNEAYKLYHKMEISYFGLQVIYLQFIVCKDLGKIQESNLFQEEINQILRQQPHLVSVLQKIKIFIQSIQEQQKQQQTQNETSAAFKQQFHLASLIDLTKILTTITENKERLKQVLLKIITAMGAERGAIFKPLNNSKKLESYFSHNLKNDETQLVLGLVLGVETHQQSYIFKDSNEIENFLPDLKKTGAKSMVCVPIYAQNIFYGTLYLDNQQLSNLFNQKDLDFLKIFASQLGLLLSLNQEKQIQPSLISKLTDSFCAKYDITKREKEILELMIQRYQYTEISKKLFISRNTVKNHVYHIFTKMGVKDKKEFFQLINQTDSNKTT